MSTKLLVTLQGQADGQTVRDSGVEILAEYPDSMLVRGTDEQAQHLSQQGIEAVPLPEQPVEVAGASFAFGDAVRAQEAASLEPAAGRTAYYLVKLAGPPAPEWLKALEGLGAELQGSLGGFTQLVGMLPERVDEVRAEPWVEEVTPYRPAMKVSPKLRTGVRRQLDTDALASVTAEDLGEQRQLVEVSVFSGESVKEVAARVREEGGSVLATHSRSLVANLDPATIAALAELQGIQAILPFAMPELHNDQAKLVMQIPVDHHFVDLTLKGTGQIVAIADSGLDSGDLLAMHADIQGRVVDVVSWPTATTWAPFVHEPGSNDGPVDENSGHGTHVTGSVLGAGTAAVQAGADPVPMGAAPEAKVFLQAIEQRVNWRPPTSSGPRAHRSSPGRQPPSACGGSRRTSTPCSSRPTWPGRGSTPIPGALPWPGPTRATPARSTSSCGTTRTC